MRNYSFITPVTSVTPRFKIILSLVLLAVIVFLLLLAPRVSMLLPKETRAISILASAIEVVEIPIRSIRTSISRMIHLRGIEEKYRKLQKEYNSLLFIQNYAEMLEKENRHLREILQYQAEAPEIFATRVIARVLARTRGSFAHNVIINAGSANGVEIGSFAIANGLLVGIVSSVGKNGARIRLLRDPQSRIAIKIPESRQRAILAGRGASEPFLLFPQGKYNVKTKTLVVTSGDAGVLPAGIPIGRVSSANNEIITVTLNANAAEIDEVDIVNYQPYDGSPEN